MLGLAALRRARGQIRTRCLRAGHFTSDRFRTRCRTAGIFAS